MMPFVERPFETDEVSGRFLVAGPANARPLLLVQGGVPGLTPYCAGAHLWGNCLPPTFSHRRVVIAELPGTGATVPTKPEALELAGLARYLGAVIGAMGSAGCHLVAHDLAALLALEVVRNGLPRPTSITLAASAFAAPTGDGVENLTLARPPRPAWSRASQRWALERLAYSHHHLDRGLVDAATAAAEGAAHRAAEAAINADGAARFQRAVMQSKGAFFALARDHGIDLPVQVIWGANDPLSTVDHGYWLFRIVAARQDASQFHVLNRCGNLLFRDEPQRFFETVLAFDEGLTERGAA